MHHVHHRHVDVGYKAHNIALRNFSKVVARRPSFQGIRMKRTREPQLIIVRNKFTKEVVDLEVSIFTARSSISVG